MSAFQLLNGLTYAALLFVVASGFTLIFGLLRIVNLAHGALYLLGGYIGFAVATRTGRRRFPIGLSMTSPCSLSAAARAGRTRNVASAFASARRPPKYPPTAPAPSTK